MTVGELVSLVTTEEVLIWDYQTENYIKEGNLLNEREIDEMNLLECEVLSIESQDNDIVVNIDTSEIGD